MFYFNSPLMPFKARRSCSSSQICKSPPRKVRIVPATMNNPTEHTFVAALLDPVFCASMSTSLIPESLIAREIVVLRENADVIGGAIRSDAPQASDGDEVMVSVAASLAISNADRSILSTTRHGQECHGIDPLQHGHIQQAAWAIQAAHQMSSSQRRPRVGAEFQAAEGVSIEADAASWSQTPEDYHRLAEEVSPTQHAAFSNARAFYDTTYNELGLGEEQVSANAQETGYQRLNEISLSQQDVHQDALSVDHSHRFYDVSDFLDHWATIRPTLETLQARKRRLTQLDQSRNVFKDSLSGPEADVQGIDWPAFKVTRNEASNARRQLHPQRDSRRDRSAVRALIEDQQQQQFYRFRSFHAHHRASTAHYQLRNVLAASSRAEIFYASGSTVTAMSLAVPGISSRIMDFNRPSTTAMPFRITCVSSSPSLYADNAVVAGGFNGEYAVLYRGSEHPASPHEGFVSHAYDGLVTHVCTYHHRHSGRLQAAFSTNDRCIRVMDVNSLKLTDVFQYNHAINASCMSPDSRLRLLVGDHPDALITDAEHGSPLVHLDAHSKDGFACAWSDDGILAATGAQDGMVAVWDTRNWSRPLSKLDCMDTCARSLNFTEDNRLVMAENEDVVTVYDAKTKTRQDIRFFGSIAGTALLDGGREIVVANSDRNVGGLIVLEQTAVLRDGNLASADHSEEMSAMLQRRKNERMIEAFGDVVI